MSGRMIGILGGAGVAASSFLVDRIVQIVTDRGAQFDQDHPELLLLHATKAPSRSLWLEGRGPSFVPPYIEAAQRLQNAGAGLIAMCCNTAHAAHAEIAGAIHVPLLNMIDCAVKQAVALTGPSAKIGIMTSSGTRTAGLYHSAARQLAPSATIIETDDGHQNNVTAGIIGVKRGQHRTHDPLTPNSPAQLFASAADNLHSQGADIIILGCTEIPLAFPAGWNTRPVVDTVDVLAHACIQWADGGEV